MFYKTKKQALEAYNTIRDYCGEQDNCNNCLFNVPDCTSPVDCLMHLPEPPEYWQSLEIE